MKLPIKNLLPVLVLFGLAACVTVSTQYGSGPIQLAPSVQQHFDRYKQFEDPRFFAVSIDGKSYGYSICRPGRVCGDFQKGVDLAVYSCLKRSKGVPCKIFGRAKQVVWKNAGPAQHFASRPATRSSFHSLNNNQICEQAIQFSAPKWEQAHPNFIAEAKARQLTEASCAKLSGRFTNIQSAPLSGKTGTIERVSLFGVGNAAMGCAPSVSYG